MSKARQLADLGNQVDDGVITGSNMVVNGGMTISQRGTQTEQTSGYTACDRWQFNENGSSIVTTTQDTNVPAGEGFASSLKIDVTSASGTPSAGNYAFVRTKFEGQDLQHIRKGTSAAKPLTLSFWVSSPKTGTHVVELYDTDNNRQVSKTYTINSANTWQHFSILMPADTTGTLDNDSNVSMQIAFWLMAGSDFSGGTLNTSWAANNNPNRAAGLVNIMDSTSNNFYITGVCLNVGDSAIDFPHERYGDTLARCQRYYYRIEGGSNAFCRASTSGLFNNGTSIRAVFQHPVYMRAVPTLGNSAMSTFDIEPFDQAPSAFVSNTGTIRQSEINVTSPTSRTTGFAAALTIDDANGYIQWDAEL